MLACVTQGSYISYAWLARPAYPSICHSTSDPCSAPIPREIKNKSACDETKPNSLFHVYPCVSPTQGLLPPTCLFCHILNGLTPLSLSSFLTQNLQLSPLSSMADRHHPNPHRPFGPSTFLHRLHEHAPNSTQLLGLLTLLIIGSVLLLLTGLTVAGTVLGLIVFAPLIIVSSPIWVPVGTLLFVVVAGFLSMCGFGVLVVAVLSWMYRYFRGLNPPGSDQIDYARNRIYDTASHVKDYAREYGGYLQSKVKDAAPGA